MTNTFSSTLDSNLSASNAADPKTDASIEHEPTMKQTTLVYVFNPEGQVLLAVKKKSDSGFDVSVDKVNTAGGKREPQETITECALRELQQEFGIIISESSLIDAGVIRFLFQTKKERDNECHVFNILNYNGKYKDSEEMKEIKYFDTTNLPRENMRESDAIRMPKMLR